MLTHTFEKKVRTIDIKKTKVRHYETTGDYNYLLGVKIAYFLIFSKRFIYYSIYLYIYGKTINKVKM